MVRLRPYIHPPNYTDPRIWQQDPFGCLESLVGLLCIGLGFWLFFSERDLNTEE